MTSTQTSSTSDLRSAAQDHKRDAAHKHKWGMGALETRGRGMGNPRPLRPSDTTTRAAPRFQFGLGRPLHHQARISRKQDMLEGTTSDEASSGNSGASDFSADDTPSPPADADITYSFDAARGPTPGSQIFNVALARAVERFEERETVKLVKDEYDVLDGDGESVASPVRKEKGKARAASGMGATRVPDADEDYEFV